MPEPTTLGSRRALATIIFTDVVGYSALMGRDEDGALTAVKRDFTLMRTLCEQHEGWAVKEIGDALMMHFSSAVKAVECAQAIQIAIEKQSQNLQPNAIVLHHRMGMHLGDVVIDNDDVRGDGVNIAARVQGAAEPDTIYMSKAVYDAVPSRYRQQARFIGSRELKNIEEPIILYALPALSGEAPPEFSQSVATANPGFKIPRWLFVGIPIALVAAVGAWQVYGMMQFNAAEQALLEGQWDTTLPELHPLQMLASRSRQFREEQQQWLTTLASLESGEALPDVPRFSDQSPFLPQATQLRNEIDRIRQVDLTIASNLRPASLYDDALPTLVNNEWEYLPISVVDQRLNRIVSLQLSDVYRTYTLTQEEIDRGERPPFRFVVVRWQDGEMYVSASILNLEDRTEEKYQLATFILSVVLLADSLPNPLPPRLGLPQEMHIHFYDSTEFQASTAITDIDSMRQAIANQSSSLTDLLATIPVLDSPQW